jgi:hypothetical protein
MMIRYLLALLLLLGPIVASQAQQNTLRPYQLQSGRTIFPKLSGPLMAPNMPKEKGYVMSYETQLTTDDMKALEDEAKDVWKEFKPSFEKIPGITMAVLQAEEKPVGGFLQQNRVTRFVIQRKPDGSWEWLQDNPKEAK